MDAVLRYIQQLLPFWKLIVVGISLGSATILLTARLYRRRREKLQLTAAKHDADALKERYSPHFNDDEIKAYARGYVEPDCSQVDPANDSEFGRFAQVREPVYKAVDRFFSDSDARHHLIVLADSGVGKTSFCVNYYNRCREKNIYPRIALISLARPDPIAQIKSIPSKSTTVILLDALDEDPNAIQDGLDRLYALMKACSEFRGVLVTCRSHFFENDAAIPNQTGITRITPRSAQGASYDLFRVYLLPFTTKQVKTFLSHRYSIFDFRARQKASDLVASIPELSARPMLLTLVPDLIKKGRRYYEIYELYDYMVEQWFVRESNWAPRDKLNDASNELAAYLSRRKQTSGNDRASPSEVRQLASEAVDLDWDLLTTRSLLNRDSEGHIKFAHRSIMEFLCVRMAIANDLRIKGLYWTGFMRELLYSYGSISIDNAREIVPVVQYLQNHRSSTKFPLAEPLAEPGLRTRNDLIYTANNHRVDHGSARDIPIGLRYTSLVFDSAPDYIKVTDREYGLVWMLPNVNSELFQMDPEIYRVSLTDASRPVKIPGARRPSFAEFISLLEAERYCTRDKEVIFDNHFYWLGDHMYGGVRLLVSPSNTLPDGTGTLLLSSIKSGGETIRANLYAIDPARVRSEGTIRGLDVMVSRLAPDESIIALTH